MDPITIAIALASQFAPGIVKAITGSSKAAEVAGKVVNIAQTITGTNTPEAAGEVLKTDPAKLLEFQKSMADIELEEEKQRYADIADARNRDIEIRKVSGGQNHRADYMVLMDVVGLIACLIVLCLYRKEIPAEAVGLISTIAAAFSLCLRDAHQFEFGSSRSSQAKDNTINNLSK